MRISLGLLLIGFFAALGVLVPSTWADEARTLRAEALRAEPYSDAPTRATVAAGKRVRVVERRGAWVKIESDGLSGWMHSVALAGNATAPIASPLAMVDAGREALRTPLATTGVRSVGAGADLNHHALIIGVAKYADPNISELTGVVPDLGRAKRMAAMMGVPDGNMRVFPDAQATRENVTRALRDLSSAAGRSSRVMVYFSGHGTRYPESETANSSCAEAVLFHDSSMLSNREMAELLRPIAERADKLFVFLDACFSGGLAKTRSAARDSTLVPRVHRSVQRDCMTPTNVIPRSILGRRSEQRPEFANFIYVAASRESEISFDERGRGGLATQYWTTCLFGEAKDEDRSGAISIAEVQACAQRMINERIRPETGYLPHHLTVTGNRGFPVAMLATSAAVPESTPTSPANLAQPPVAPPKPGATALATQPIASVPGSTATSVPVPPANSNTTVMGTPAQQPTASPPTNAPGPAPAAVASTTPFKPEAVAPVKPPLEAPATNLAGQVPAAPAPAPAPVAQPNAPSSPQPAADAHATLLDLHAQRDASRTVKVAPGTARLRIGRDELSLRVTSSRAGYLYLLLAGSDKNSLYLIYPNHHDRDNRIEANKMIELPRPNWAIKAGGPAGRNRLLVMVADSERDTSRLPSKPAGAFAKLAAGNGGDLLQAFSVSGFLQNSDCTKAGRRNLVVEQRCSSSFGAALVHVDEVK
jgi:hypothetical protein